MKKLTLIVVVLIMALGVLALPTAAQDDLTSLARYFPADAPAFAALRTDDQFLATLDTLASKFGALAPGGWTPGSLMDMLDTAAAQVQPGGTFATVFRPWLGDSAAIGLYELRAQSSSNPVPPITIAIRISDQDKAETLFDALPNAERYTLSEGDGYTLYSPKTSGSSDPYFLFRSDVVLITGDQALVDAGGVLTDSLSGSADFTTAVGMLPADNYAVVAYGDTPGALNYAMQQSSSRSRNAAAMSAVTAMLSAVKPQAFGITLVDERALTLDIAAPLDASASSPFALTSASTPVDSSFAQHIPASVPVAILGTDLYDNLQRALGNLRAFANAASTDNTGVNKQLQTALLGVNFVVRGLTGMEIDEALGWMTGNYALALGFSPSFSDIRDLTQPPGSNPLDFGFIVEATDAGAAQALFDALSNSLDNMQTDNFAVTQTTLDDGTAALSLKLTSKSLGFPVELQVATGSGVFVIGTPRMVSAALNPPSAGLDRDPSFIDASHYMLDNANAILFVSGDNLHPLARAMTASGNPQSLRQTGKQVQAVLDLLSSATISSTALPDNAGTLTRVVWTLPE